MEREVKERLNKAAEKMSFLELPSTVTPFRQGPMAFKGKPVTVIIRKCVKVAYDES